MQSGEERFCGAGKAGTGVSWPGRVRLIAARQALRGWPGKARTGEAGKAGKDWYGMDGTGEYGTGEAGMANYSLDTGAVVAYS